MNKRLLLVLLILFPIFINAKECDSKAHADYVKLAESITYDNNYSKSAGTFSIVIYNIFDGMYVKNGKTEYKPNKDNTVTIPDIKEGSTVTLYVYVDDGCGAIKNITVIEKFFNKYYGASVCNGYDEKVNVCSSQFTSSKVTYELVLEAIKNYNGETQSVPEHKVEEEKTIVQVIVEFFKEWGIKILLVIFTLFITSTLYNIKFRKMKHGI